MSSGTLIPPALQKGDTIALISPSARLNEVLSAALARTRSQLEGLGFNTKVIYHGALSGPHISQVDKRVDELNSAFADPSVKAIICTSGGNHASELLRRIDYDLVRKNPKIFSGYSDITCLHNALLTQAGLRTFYGPTCLIEFGVFPAPIQFTVDHFLKVLCNPGQAVGPFPRSKEWAPDLPSFVVGKDKDAEDAQVLVPSPNWRWVRPGKGEGRILGGVFTSLLETAGTKFWPDFQGAILLLETSFSPAQLGAPVPVARTRSQLAQLANIGIFDQINGLVFGRQVGQSEQFDAEVAQLLLDQCYGTNFPILMNADFGHTDPKLTLPLGSLVRLDAEKDEFVGLEPAVL